MIRKMTAMLLCFMLFVLAGCGLKMPDNSDSSPSGSESGNLPETSILTGIVSAADSETITINLVKQGVDDTSGRTVVVGGRTYSTTGGTYLVTPNDATMVILENQGYVFGSLQDIEVGEFLAVTLNGDDAVMLIDGGQAQESDTAPSATDDDTETNDDDDISPPAVTPNDSNNDSDTATNGVPDSSDSKTYTVITDGLKVRSGPGTSYSVLGVIDTGSRVIGTVSDGWLKFTDKGQTAYCSAEYIEVSKAPTGVPDSGESKTYTTTDNLLARSGPGTSYSSLGTLEKGAKITGTVEYGWLKFTYENSTSFCSAAYLSAG